MKIAIEQHKLDQYAIWQRKLLPFAILLMVECAILLLDAVISLYSLTATFRDALLTRLGIWPLLPSLLLFPHWRVIPPLYGAHVPAQIINLGSKVGSVMLFAAFLIVFLLYMLALLRLPHSVGRRYILYSTLLLGITCLLIPIVTSPDLYSYIAYARIGILYHLNPLTTLPTAISSDPVYSHLYWTTQPSAYGPTWIAITGFLQWLALALGFKDILSMVLALRLLGLATHLGSTLLVWSIGSHLQRQSGATSSKKLVLATLAFAWNPLLLFEACVNAHNDSTVLFLILLSIWFLVRRPLLVQLWNVLSATAILALAICLKLNVAVLFPGLLLFLWAQQPHDIQHRVRAKLIELARVLATYLGVIVLLYASFWQNGTYLKVFQVNPSTIRNINSIPDVLTRIYNSIMAGLGYPLAPGIGSPAEHITHTLSMGLFLILYVLLCWRSLRAANRINTLPKLIRWMALVWLLYCFIGSPWYWPWYIVTFFGLYALIEATRSGEQPFLGFLPFPFAARLLTFSTLTLYCFYALASATFPGLPALTLASLGGLWIWIVPLGALLQSEKVKVEAKHDIVEHVDKREIHQERLGVGHLQQDQRIAQEPETAQYQSEPTKLNGARRIKVANRYEDQNGADH